MGLALSDTVIAKFCLQQLAYFIRFEIQCGRHCRNPLLLLKARPEKILPKPSITIRFRRRRRNILFFSLNIFIGRCCFVYFLFYFTLWGYGANNWHFNGFFGVGNRHFPLRDQQIREFGRPPGPLTGGSKKTFLNFKRGQNAIFAKHLLAEKAPANKGAHNLFEPFRPHACNLTDQA